jgi:hypothetical protein
MLEANFLYVSGHARACLRTTCDFNYFWAPPPPLFSILNCISFSVKVNYLAKRLFLDNFYKIKITITEIWVERY